MFSRNRLIVHMRLKEYRLALQAREPELDSQNPGLKKKKKKKIKKKIGD